MHISSPAVNVMPTAENEVTMDVHRGIDDKPRHVRTVVQGAIECRELR